LRNGSISEINLRKVLDNSNNFKNVSIIKFKKENYVKEDENAEAPGQLLKHYSPNCETYLI